MLAISSNKKHYDCITITTDASFKYGIASYAFWISMQDCKITGSGGIKRQVRGCTQAEVMAIGNAIYTLLKRADQISCDRIYINTDSIGAMSAIDRQIDVDSRLTWNLKNELQKKLGCRFVEFRHVKGHGKGDTARSWVNKWCDREAGQARRNFEDTLTKAELAKLSFKPKKKPVTTKSKKRKKYKKRRSWV